MARWLWEDRGAAARATRALLVPASLLYQGVMALRAAAYRSGVLRSRALPLPSVAVGNLSVGGTGKTPVASWIAGFFAARGERPGILLRGYGADEPLVHRLLVPDAIVVADADRHAAAARARAAGATVLVLDDAYQRLDVRRDVDIVLISAESVGHAPWALPAGPWREGKRALARANVIVVTRRGGGGTGGPTAEAAAALAARLGSAQAIRATVQLGLVSFAALRGGRRLPLETVSGKRVLVAAGIADPGSLARQLAALGASVQLVAYQDHHHYAQSDLDRLAQAAPGVDYVVVTQKDAVKLRDRWPAAAPEPLVAEQAVQWETNGDAVIRILDGLLSRTP